MNKRVVQPLRKIIVATSLGIAMATASAAPLPGEGVTVQPGQDHIDGENFQTILVMKALERLGYTVKAVQNAKYPALHIATANGEVTFIADHWNPLHTAFFDKAGGAEKLSAYSGENEH